MYADDTRLLGALYANSSKPMSKPRGPVYMPASRDHTLHRRRLAESQASVVQHHQAFHQAVEVLLAPHNLTSHPGAVVDEPAAGGSLDARIERAWRTTILPGGSYFFPLHTMSLPSVQAWAFELTHRMSVYAGHVQRGYMGKPTPHQRAAVERAQRHPLPPHAAFLFCARSGCALSKVGPCDCQPSKTGQAISPRGGSALAACAAAREPSAVRACAGSSRRAADTVALARSGVRRPISDKIDTSGYQIMYGALLGRAKASDGGASEAAAGGSGGGGRAVDPLRLFEVGLGCDQQYGPGASVGLWQRHLRPRGAGTAGLELWEGELDATRRDAVKRRPHTQRNGPPLEPRVRERRSWGPAAGMRAPPGASRPRVLAASFAACTP